MSLRWRIMGSIVLVIVLTVLISAGVGYYATQSRLDVFVDGIGDDEATRLARNLSREYTAAGGWETVDRPLSEAGYLYDGVLQSEQHEEGEGESLELFHKDPVRVVIAGVDGRVVMDNLSELSPGTATPDLDGHRETVFDLTTDQPVCRPRLCGCEPRPPVGRVARVSQHAPVHHRNWRDADGRRCHTAGGLVVQAYNGPRNGLDGGDPVNCPRGYDPAAGHVLG